jgi:hypothetical protein
MQQLPVSDIIVDKEKGDKILNHVPAPVAEAVPEVCLSATDMIKKNTGR